ncbi:MAG: tRNA lysidine(34) synthetase TilS [Minwuia sp.]|uniref:tRNA lysidine(34) synthetase TilS n=1 Tax=Minwuia sp. TaxID=2493630 RepID=UPI003A85D1E7
MRRATSPAAPSGSARTLAADGAPDDAIGRALARFEGEAPLLAVALSGGPDSTALLHLAIGWTERHAGSVAALTVDHGLRPESGDEARLVADRAAAAGAISHILRWTGPKPDSGIQDAARNARYALMLDWCREHGAAALLVGHHRDDQAATVLMRLQRGSGPDGLAAMRPATERDGVLLLRPLLETGKTTLLDWLAAQGHPFVEDPSNRLDRFERNRLDRLLAAEDPDGGLAGRLGRAAGRQARAVEALERWTADAEAALSRGGGNECTALDLEGWLALPDEIRLRLLGRAVARASGREPGLGALETALEQLASQARTNLAGALIERSGGLLHIRPEPPRRHS